jgi:hypothetical protein
MPWLCGGEIAKAAGALDQPRFEPPIRLIPVVPPRGEHLSTFEVINEVDWCLLCE